MWRLGSTIKPVTEIPSKSLCTRELQLLCTWVRHPLSPINGQKLRVSSTLIQNNNIGPNIGDGLNFVACKQTLRPNIYKSERALYIKKYIHMRIQDFFWEWGCQPFGENGGTNILRSVEVKVLVLPIHLSASSSFLLQFEFGVNLVTGTGLEVCLFMQSFRGKLRPVLVSKSTLIYALDHC